MKISKSYDKRTGRTYVYEVLENYWDPELKQPRNKRRLIGRWDPETEQIVPTRKKKKVADKKTTEKNSNEKVDYQALYQKTLDDLNRAEEENKILRCQIEQLTSCLQEVSSSVTRTLDTVSKS